MTLKLPYIVIFLLTLFFHCCQLQRRIFNGNDAEFKQFPYVVNVRATYYTCGGALLDSKYVITAGHCIMNLYDTDEVVVILGAHNYYDNGEPGRIRMRSRKHWVHENFSMPYAENDLGIIELPIAVNFTDQIYPIKLSTNKYFDVHSVNNDKETIVVLSGWGYQSNDFEPAEILQTARMKLLSYDECKKFQNHYTEKVTENHICAVGRDNRPGNIVLPCDGDSGSPLVLSETQELIGITSYVKDAENGSALNFNDCKTEVPAVFIRIPSYLDWIQNKTGIKFN